MKRLLAISCLLCAGLWAGCGSSAANGASGATTPAATEPNAEADVQCQEEVRTGTNLSRKICRSQLERDRDKDFAREMILNPSSRPGVR